MPRAVQSLNLRILKLRLFNNSVFECLEGLTYLDPRLRGDDGRLLTVVIPAKAGI
jgi:hypothetical protein